MPTRSWGGAYGGFVTCGTYSDLSCFACLVAGLRSVKKTAKGIDRRKSQGADRSRKDRSNKLWGFPRNIVAASQRFAVPLKPLRSKSPAEVAAEARIIC